MSIIGYARTYKSTESKAAQIDALMRAGCERIFEEHQASGDLAPPVLAGLSDKMQVGDKLVVVRLDRLSKFISVQIEIIDRIISKGGSILSLRDEIDTAVGAGKRRLHNLRLIIEERNPPVLGNNSLKLQESSIEENNGIINYSDNPKIPTAKRVRHRKLMQEISAAEADWVPYVKVLRPNTPWKDVASAINSNKPNSGPWSSFRLQRAVRAYVGYGFLSRCVLDKQRRVVFDQRLISLVHSIRTSEPHLTVTEVSRRLEALGEPAPRGGKKWNHSVVAALLRRAEIINANKE